jgi:quercetin dioxygenase-like cupin family protein
MDVRTRGSYEIENRELVAEGADLRVQVLTLTPGQCVPWHYHSEVTDSFVCLEGQTIIETKGPEQPCKLQPGQRYAVAPNTAHTVYGGNDNRCKFMVIQGVGVYDFVPVQK